MPKKDNKILKYNHGEKSMKLPFIIYAHMESLLNKINTSYKNPKISSTSKINLRTAFGFSLFTHYSFDVSKNKFDGYKGKDCMKSLCKDLREHEIKMINC